jgi:hypothetical protein
LEPSNIIDLPVDINNTELNKANSQQQIIGWQHFIRVRLSIAWGKTINRHLDKLKLHPIHAEKWRSGSTLYQLETYSKNLK